ncbi:MAG: phosphatase PAP2 family protein [Sulfurovaceae bacterium]|nr:phosphatase PAP2 family protein [Sulfurovaceae bacterium]
MKIIPTILLLVISILIFQYTTLDITIEDWFYNFKDSTWIVDENNKLLSCIFYGGAKKAITVFGVLILIALIFFRKNNTIKKYQTGLLIVLLSLIIVPSVTGGLKATTNMPCPNQEIRYGGIYPKTKLWESYPSTFVQPSRVKCYPAGHASGGFALLSLYFLFKKPRNKKLAVIGALALGWIMGLYKMMVGDHFMGHTVTTMLLAWILILLIAKAVYYYRKEIYETDFNN